MIDWSKGLGKSVDIPEYLWWKKGAQIRLRNLSKRDTELFIKVLLYLIVFYSATSKFKLFIKDVWKAKKIADAMQKDKAQALKKRTAEVQKERNSAGQFWLN